MPTMTLMNPYQGINAHLHSMVQNPEDSPSIWAGIHSDFITYLVAELNRILPPNYIARSEQSLQIITDSDMGLSSQRPKPDISIFRNAKSDSTISQTHSSASSVRIVPLADYLDEEDYFWASAVIYRVKEHGNLGYPITRIEILSASNKVGGSGYEGYKHNRHRALISGTSLVEIDMLHQTASPLPGIPTYPDEEDSHPYYVAVTDARTKHNPEHVMMVHIINVDEILPQNLRIPLADDDFVTVKIDKVYQQTFSAGRLHIVIDYDYLPRKFETYSKSDQERIKAVIQRAKEIADAQ